MSSEKKHFFVKLVPPRATFIMDMTDAERAIMEQHKMYWGELLEKGTAIAYGPVLDPKGAFGVGVICVNTNDELQQVIANDPANGLNKYEYAPMMAFFKRS
ncbi:MAG TPA: YciI family protein [Chryseolinea sp.]|nr:YciI family protein [Chryseolinea sp.]